MRAKLFSAEPNTAVSVLTKSSRTNYSPELTQAGQTLQSQAKETLTQPSRTRTIGTQASLAHFSLLQPSPVDPSCAQAEPRRTQSRAELSPAGPY